MKKQIFLIGSLLLLFCLVMTPSEKAQANVPAQYDPGICFDGDGIWAACNFPGTHCSSPLWCKDAKPKEQALTPA